LKLEFDYDLDLWGKNRAAYAVALGAVRVAEIEREMAKLALISSITRVYIRLDHAFQQLGVETELLRQREQIAELTLKRVASGLDSALELKHSQGLVASARADIRSSEERVALLRNQLAALAGAGPDRGISLKPPALLAQQELSLPAQLPSELIGRRPDVVAQLWRIEVMTKGIAEARAAFYPNISLTAFAGFDSIGIENILRGGSGVFGVGPALTLPIFDGGRLRGNLTLRRAEYDENVERYNALIVDAIREVADHLVSWRGIESQLTEEQEAEAKLEEANRLALLRYRQGLTGYLTVLATEGDLLRERLRTVALKARKFEVAVNLSTSLGGGYQPEPPAGLKDKNDQGRSVK
jgi:NodT family efflux transporter outer membrane factor (OMF) lipoprotein